ncbi:Stf0 family sulfotransferase [Agrobacterium vitis]|uniref:Stf0 family sulfotransferase n=1 Tax=Agrobacterium vitis TaxID=373 RepID=UPI003D2E6025
MTRFISYLIRTSSRSSSTLLCKLLAQTGIAGNPKSYLHREPISDWLAYLDLDKV